jgi:hypothetical protein
MLAAFGLCWVEGFPQFDSYLKRLVSWTGLDLKKHVMICMSLGHYDSVNLGLCSSFASVQFLSWICLEHIKFDSSNVIAIKDIVRGILATSEGGYCIQYKE